MVHLHFPRFRTLCSLLSSPSGDQITRYLNILYARNYALGTLKGVVTVLIRFLHALPASRLSFVKQNFANVIPADLDALLEPAKINGLAPSTINNSVTLLRGFFEFLRETGERPALPIIRHRHSVLEPTTLPKPMAEADLVAFFKAIDAVRDRAIFLLMLRCGLRISEVCALTWQVVDFTQGTLLIVNGKG